MGRQMKLTVNITNLILCEVYNYLKMEQCCLNQTCVQYLYVYVRCISILQQRFLHNHTFRSSVSCLQLLFYVLQLLLILFMIHCQIVALFTYLTAIGKIRKQSGQERSPQESSIFTATNDTRRHSDETRVFSFQFCNQCFVLDYYSTFLRQGEEKKDQDAIQKLSRNIEVDAE